MLDQAWRVVSFIFLDFFVILKMKTPVKKERLKIIKLHKGLTYNRNYFLERHVPSLKIRVVMAVTCLYFKSVNPGHCLWLSNPE